MSSSFDMVIASTVPREDVVSTNLVTSATLLPSPLSAFRKYVPFSPSEYKCVSSWPVRSPLHNVTNWPSKDIPQTTCIADSSHLPQTCVTGVEKGLDCLLLLFFVVGFLIIIIYFFNLFNFFFFFFFFVGVVFNIVHVIITLTLTLTLVLTAHRNTLVISPYCVISLVKIFIFIEWLYSTPKVLCYVIKTVINSY